MVGIVQTEAAARLFQLLGREAFERGLSGDWHEQGQLDGAMREMQCCRAGFRGLGEKIIRTMAYTYYHQCVPDGQRPRTEHRASKSNFSAGDEGFGSISSCSDIVPPSAYYFLPGHVVSE